MNKVVKSIIHLKAYSELHKRAPASLNKKGETNLMFLVRQFCSNVFFAVPTTGKRLWGNLIYNNKKKAIINKYIHFVNLLVYLLNFL